MPGVSKVKNLHMAKSLKELNEKVAPSDNIATTNLLLLCKTGDKLLKMGEKCQFEGDEEMAYVCYMRYCNLYQQIKKKSSLAKNDKKICDVYLGVQSFKSALTCAEQLSKSLERRYQALEESCSYAENGNNLVTPKLNSSSESPVKDDVKDAKESPVSLGDATEQKVKEAIPVQTNITSEKLYELINDSSTSLLILDARPAKEYEASHMICDKCINVPAENISPGITSVKLGNLLPKESIELWSKRGQVDFVILLDKNSYEADLTDFSPLSSLHSAIYKWDQSVTLKSQPLILQGGFSEWSLHFPSLTTNPQISLQSSPPKSLKNGILGMEISYPDFDNLLTPEKPKEIVPKENATTPQTPSAIPRPVTSPVDSSSPSIPIKPKSAIPEIDRKKKPIFLSGSRRSSVPDATVSSNSSLPRPTQTVSKESDLDTIPKEEAAEKVVKAPVVDRSSKPSKIPLRTPQKSDSPITVDSVTDEGSTMSSLIGKEKPEVHEEVNEVIKSSLDITGLQPQGDNSKEQKLASVKLDSIENNIPALSKDEVVVKTTKTVVPDSNDSLNNSVSHENVPLNIKSGSILKKKGVVTTPKSQMKTNATSSVIDEEFYTVPLSDRVPLRDRSNTSSSKESAVKKSGLSRSYSSPNIAKMVEEEGEKKLHKTGFVPHFDRSLKPNLADNAKNNRSLSQMPYGGLDGGKPIHPRNFAPIYGNQGYGVTGLKNLGNTCFMNSIVQCLAATTPLALYFVHGEHVADINSTSKFGTKGNLARDFAQLIRAMWTGQYRSLTPKDFKETVGYYMPMFVGNDQHDAHEFLVMLLEKLHADLNKESSANKVPPLKLPEGLSQEEAAILFWMHHRQYNNSVVSRLFEGLLCSTLTCQSCNEMSNTFEVFRCLSLPIPSGSKPSIEHCLREFSKPEMISGESGWDCPKCKQKRKAEKQITISRFPEILILQLKRFSYDGMWRKKIQTYVDFPLGQFHLSCGQFQKQYNLYAVSNHYGTLEGGHYIAYCDNSPKKKWFKFDDNEVTELNRSDVKTQAAYILFYTSVDFQECLT